MTQVYTENGDRKVKVSSSMSSKFKSDSFSESFVKRILDKNGAMISSLTFENTLDDDVDFDSILKDLSNCSDLFDRKILIAEAEQIIENVRKSYDRKLSNPSLSSDDRSEIKTIRDDLIKGMVRKLDDVLSENVADSSDEYDAVEESRDDYSEIEDETSEIIDNRNEDDVYMDLNSAGVSGIENMTYTEYLCDLVKKGIPVRTIMEFLVNGREDVNVFSAEQFGSEKRGKVELAKQRKIEGVNRSLEGQLIDNKNELASAKDSIERLNTRSRNDAEQISQLVSTLEEMRNKKRSLEQNNSEKDHTILELNRKIKRLEEQLKSVNDDNSKKQEQILELKNMIKALQAQLDEAKSNNENLRTEHAEFAREKDAEIAKQHSLIDKLKKERVNLNAILNGVRDNRGIKTSESESPVLEAESEEDSELALLKKGFEDLNRVIGESNSFEDSEVHIR